MSDPDRVCCLCGDKLDSKPDLEEHISLRHWDIFDDGRPPSNNDQEAATSSASQPDVVANGSNPGDKAAVDGDAQDAVVQDPEAARPGHSQQMGSSPKAPSPTPGPSKGNGSRATQSSPQAGPSKIPAAANNEINEDRDEGRSKDKPVSVKRELDSPVAGCSKRIRTASGTKSGKDNHSPPATIIKIKKEVVPEVGSSPTKSIQDGGERTYFARKSDPPTPKKVPERNETSESGTSCCPICQKSFKGPRSLKRHKRRHHSSDENAHDTTNSQTSAGHQTPSRSERKLEVTGQNESQGAPETTFSCRICNQKFESASQLRVHAVSSHKEPEKTEPAAKTEKGPEVKDPASYCFICNHQFPTQSNLNRHNIRKHIDGEKYSCPESGCTRQFKIMYDLVRHRRNIHGLQS